MPSCPGADVTAPDAVSMVSVFCSMVSKASTVPISVRRRRVRLDVAQPHTAAAAACTTCSTNPTWYHVQSFLLGFAIALIQLYASTGMVASACADPVPLCHKRCLPCCHHDQSCLTASQTMPKCCLTKISQKPLQKSISS